MIDICSARVFWRALILVVLWVTAHPALPVRSETMRLSFEDEGDLLKDFVTQFQEYNPLGKEGLQKRGLSISEGRFGKGLRIGDGWPISKGTWNESGLDCDLIVATMWGEWHTKPHYWGAGGFHGDSGSVAFWVKKEEAYPGVVFMQGHIGWGRAERDLFNVEVDEQGFLHAFIRDVRYRYHRVESEKPVWKVGEWQHIAVVWDRAYGMRLYHNGTSVGSSWGRDAWWLTGQPGLFSPFLPESSYDEIVYYDNPLSDLQVADLYRLNRIETADSPEPLDEAAIDRLATSFAEFDKIEVPTLKVSSDTVLSLQQIVPEDCHDGTVSAWWVMDGRYELAWPHPDRMFTFILGDVDFKGTQVEIELPKGPEPNFVFFEGVLSDVVLNSRSETPREVARTGEYPAFFYSQPIQMPEGEADLHIPLSKGFGSPPDLEGSARIPLTGDTRIQEMSLWAVEETSAGSIPEGMTVRFDLTGEVSPESVPRYGGALNKLQSRRARRTVVSSETPPSAPASVVFDPLVPLNLFSPGLGPDRAVDAVHLDLRIRPNRKSDILWVKFRDPANPNRIWSQTCLRVEYPETDSPQRVRLVYDLADLFLASEDRLWVELVSLSGGHLELGRREEGSGIELRLADDPESALAAYAAHQLHATRLQFSKEYNYRPWTLTREAVTLNDWSQFGGPYDIAYPILAVLRHAPRDPLAKIYEEMVFKRGRRAWVPVEAVKRPVAPQAPPNAPSWAIWERELVRINEQVTHWIAKHQRDNGEFWGGWNDDSFIPLGFPALPLLGDRLTRDSWLRFYDGLEEAGIFADGYCDIWPIDPLHITDFIASRGLMLAFGLGNPQVFERELRTAERYKEKVDATNARLEGQGARILTGDRDDRERKDTTLVEQMEAEILKYSSTHLNWYLGATDPPGPHSIDDLESISRQMRDAVLLCDPITEFDFTQSMIHTDGQGVGIGRNELVKACLGGYLQGRIESTPHSIALSWEGEERILDLARLVEKADTQGLSVRFYNFGDRAIATRARVWQLRSGLYEVFLESLEAESESRALSETYRKPLKRFDTIEVLIPPQTNCRLGVRLLEERARLESLADLAIAATDVVIDGQGRLHVTVHNIGAAPVQGFEAALLSDGKEINRVRVASLGSPAEAWKPQRAEIVFDNLPKRSWISVALDPENSVDEILEENNLVVIEAP